MYVCMCVYVFVVILYVCMCVYVCVPSFQSIPYSFLDRLAHVLSSLNHTVSGPAFAIHAIELQSVARDGKMYGTKNSVFGPVSDVLLSDKFLFQ